MDEMLKPSFDRTFDKNSQELFPENENLNSQTDIRVNLLSLRLDKFAQFLQLYPFKQGKYLGKLYPVSQKAIKPVFMICPNTTVCSTSTCNP